MAAKDLDDEDEGKGKGAKSKLGGKKKLIVIAAAAVLLLGGGGAAFMFMGGGGGEHGEAHGGGGGGHGAEPKKAAFVELPEMVVNLATSGERTQYVRLKVALEVADPKASEEITPVMPRVVDAFQVHLRELRPSDLSGSAGLYRLKEELRRRVDVAIQPAKIEAVLFREIVVQ